MTLFSSTNLVSRRGVLKGAGALSILGAAIGIAGPAIAVGPWGGHSNGYIPTSALAELASVGAPGRFLRADAAASFGQLSNAFAATFGATIPVTDAYRSYAAQVRLKAQKGDLAATPGTSNHGWALAVDLGGGINTSYSTPQHLWMVSNAPAYGWINPPWAKPGPGFQKREPWHWEYVLDGSPTSPESDNETDIKSLTQEEPMFVAINKSSGIGVLVYPSGFWAFVTDGSDAAALATAGVPTVNLTVGTFAALTPASRQLT